MEYDNNNSGVLFRNDKGDNPKRPDYKGSAEIDGVEYWVSSWIKEGAKGKFLSMRFEKKEEKLSEGTVSPPKTDDLPF